MLTQALLDLSLVYRKNEVPTSHPEQRSYPASTFQLDNMATAGGSGTLSADKTGSTVEKVLHIHRSRCAERPLFLLARFLSNIGSASIQCLSSRSVSA
jgi:hypothetical protein